MIIIFIFLFFAKLPWLLIADMFHDSTVMLFFLSYFTKNTVTCGPSGKHSSFPSFYCKDENSSFSWKVLNTNSSAGRDGFMTAVQH